MEKTLYICMTEYLKEHGFTGHIKHVRYYYRRMYNSRRGKSASQRLAEYRAAAAKESTNAS